VSVCGCIVLFFGFFFFPSRTKLRVIRLVLLLRCYRGQNLPPQCRMVCLCRFPFIVLSSPIPDGSSSFFSPVWLHPPTYQIRFKLAVEYLWQDNLFSLSPRGTTLLSSHGLLTLILQQDLPLGERNQICKVFFDLVFLPSLHTYL